MILLPALSAGTSTYFSCSSFKYAVTCYSNNNFVTTAVLGVRNYVLLETRLREFNRTAVDVGGVGDLDFECVTKMDDISILLIRSDNQ